MSIGRRIAETRAKAGLTQKDLADAIGVSVQAVSQWETGKSSVSSARIKQLGELLLTSEDWISGKEVEHAPVDPNSYDKSALINRVIDVIELSNIVEYLSSDKLNQDIIVSYEDYSGNIEIKGKGFGIFSDFEMKWVPHEDTTEFWIFDTGVVPIDGDIVVIAIPKHPVFHLKSLGAEIDVRIAFRRFRKLVGDDGEVSTELEDVYGDAVAPSQGPAVILAVRVERRTFRHASVVD